MGNYKSKLSSTLESSTAERVPKSAENCPKDRTIRHWRTAKTLAVTVMCEVWSFKCVKHKAGSTRAAGGRRVENTWPVRFTVHCSLFPLPVRALRTPVKEYHRVFDIHACYLTPFRHIKVIPWLERYATKDVNQKIFYSYTLWKWKIKDCRRLQHAQPQATARYRPNFHFKRSLVIQPNYHHVIWRGKEATARIWYHRTARRIWSGSKCSSRARPRRSSRCTRTSNHSLHLQEHRACC